MAKLQRVHYFRIKVTFDKPVSARDAAYEVKNTAALSYETEYGNQNDFKMRAPKHLPAR